MRWQCNRFTMPLALGGRPLFCCRIPCCWQSSPQRGEVNWAPRSEVMSDMLKWVIQCAAKAVQSAKLVAALGVASIHLEDLLVMMKRWVLPLEGSSGPIRSAWMWLNQQPSTGMGSGQTWM